MPNTKATNTKCLHTATEAEPVNPEPPLKTPNPTLRKTSSNKSSSLRFKALGVYEPAEASVRVFGAEKGLGQGLFDKTSYSKAV